MASTRDRSSLSTLTTPRQFPSTGFELIDRAEKVEEEKLPFDKREVSHEDWSSHSRPLSNCREAWVWNQLYRVAGPSQKYWTLRVHVNDLPDHNQELQVYQHLAGANVTTDGRDEHPDLHSDNLLIAITSDSVLAKVEQNEVERPSPRKQTDEVTIQVSQYVLGGAGPLTICDLGQARIGDEHFGNAMPLPYRAPEVILDMPWGYRVDNWSVGLLAWDLLERGNLFTVYDHESKEKNDAHHLAAMTALLGPPPAEFLKRSEEADKYWEDDGQWKGLVPLPDISFERLAGTLQGEDKEVFIDFVQGFLAWLPEERLDILQGCMHSWLRGEAQAPSDQQ
ncbi:Dual specificity protein kinase CLK2 like [Verticillium longisporum]|nr:Dual specificity protein kinase CLK2 like [Verticillium longisporum]